MDEPDLVQQHLRVLIANEKREPARALAQVVIGLGHDVIAREIYVREVGSATAREQPDVAIVGLGISSEHALDLIAEIVREASCPVIALLHANDPAYIHEAAKRGVFAYIVDGTPEELQSAIDITLAAVQRVPEPAGRVRAARGHRAGKGDPDGASRDDCRQGIRDAARSLATQRPQARRCRRGSRREPLVAAAALRGPRPTDRVSTMPVSRAARRSAAAPRGRGSRTRR